MKKQVMCWIGLLACCLGFLMAASPVRADEDLMEKGLWDNSVSTADINGQSNSDLINSASTANLPYFPFQKISTSGMRSVGTNVAIDKDATLTFVLPAGSSFSTVGYKSNGKDVGNNFDKFILVLSVIAKNPDNSTYLDFAKGPIKAHVGSVTGNNPVKTDKSGSYIPISNNSDLIQMGDHKIILKQDLYFTVDLATAAPFDIDQITVSQQFGNLGASTANKQTSYIKLKMGVLSFSLTLQPKLTNVFLFPTPITVDGDKYLGIASGTGTLAKDSIRWAVNATAKTDSDVATTVSDTKKWLWLIPDNGDTEAIKGGAQLSVLETSGQGDTSTTDQSKIDDNSKYLNTEGGQALVDKLTDLVKKYKEGSADPTVLDNIIKEVETTITDINDTIDLEKEIETTNTDNTLGYHLTVDGNPDYLFTNKTYNQATTDAISGKLLNNPTASVTVHVANSSGDLASNAVEKDYIQWHVYRHGTATDVSKDITLDTGTTDNTGVSCTVSVAPGADLIDLSSGIDVVATFSIGSSGGSGGKVAHSFNVMSLTQDPGTIDVTQTTSGKLALTDLPTNTDGMQFTWSTIPNVSLLGTTMDNKAATTNLSGLTYLNNGDWYQVAITKDGHTAYSNIVQLAVTGKQPPSIVITPSDMTFKDKTASDQATDPRLDQLINGTFSNWEKPLTADGVPFAFGSHTGAGTNWAVSAAIAPFTTNGGKSLGGDTQLKFKFRATYGQDDNNNPSNYKNGDDGAGQESPAVATDNQSTVLFHEKSDADFTLYGYLSAKMIVHAPAAQATNYHSTITWTAGANTSTPAAK